MGLVECDSEILVVGYKDFDMLHFVVFKLTYLIQQRYIPITSIGGNTLFISERNLSVAPKALPTPVGDSVVCLEPRQHNLVHLYGPAPVGPCSLIHLIFSCCIRIQWYPSPHPFPYTVLHNYSFFVLANLLCVMCL